MITNKITRLIIFTMAFVFITKSFAQSLPDSTIKKIDNLFLKWNNPNSPGCTVGIVRNDSLIFSKGYGMANLEYNIPNEPQTLFNMASVSKQFTGYSIVLLVREGKLNLEDDIHKWIPWFPDLKETITIRNLLNHTSGIRDQWQLLAITGTRQNDVITQDHIIKILSKQQALNFKPGDKYCYSNSNYTMLAEIVKAASGKTLRQFTDSAIFKPLGMTNTHFHDDYEEIEKNRSYSYNRKDSTHFSNAIISYSVAGATSLYTNINDMSKWVMNFYDPKAGDAKDIEMLTTPGKLNNGKELEYALGIGKNTYKGWRQYLHAGGDAGYRTQVDVFPDLKMGFIVFSNVGDFNPFEKVYAMADLFINDTTTKKEDEVKIDQRDSIAAVLKDTLSIKKFTGYYIGEEGFPVRISLKNNKLCYQFFNGTSFLIKPFWEGDLIKESKDTFSLADIIPEVKVIFSINIKDTTVHIITPDEEFKLNKYINDTLQTNEVLKKYTGYYYCPELDCKYGIVLKNNHLYLTNSKYNDVKLTLIGQDHLLNDSRWIKHIMMKRDSKSNITGFEVNQSRIKHLIFNKIE
jgi:CubicO group peptidase (beta-lactamase class C family)